MPHHRRLCFDFDGASSPHRRVLAFESAVCFNLLWRPLLLPQKKTLYYSTPTTMPPSLENLSLYATSCLFRALSFLAKTKNKNQKKRKSFLLFLLACACPSPPSPPHPHLLATNRLASLAFALVC